MSRIADYFHPDYIVDANYNSGSGQVTLYLAKPVELDEDALKMIILGIDKMAQGKRRNIDFPISEKEIPDVSPIIPKLRVDKDGQRNEIQLEYTPQFVLWLKYPDFRKLNAVNPFD